MAPALAQAARTLEPQVRLAKLDTEAHPQVRRPTTSAAFRPWCCSRAGEVARISGALVRRTSSWVRSAL
jgi:thioredoxin 2